MHLSEHYHVILPIQAKIDFNLFDEVVGKGFGELALVGETFYKVLSANRTA
ncbi:MAG: hypothetical protein O8C61_02410 [Candidatus Methanoperedens sp.]|nr:hypothetical protein [Candidatus Methanoperedens sp.]